MPDRASTGVPFVLSHWYGSTDLQKKPQGEKRGGEGGGGGGRRNLDLLPSKQTRGEEDGEEDGDNDDALEGKKEGAGEGK